MPIAVITVAVPVGADSTSVDWGTAAVFLPIAWLLVSVPLRFAGTGLRSGTRSTRRWSGFVAACIAVVLVMSFVGDRSGNTTADRAVDALTWVPVSAIAACMELTALVADLR